VKSHLKGVKSRYLAHEEQVYTRTDMLKIALRDQYVPEDWHLRGQ
jgi:hypothetical protein